MIHLQKSSDEFGSRIGLIFAAIGATVIYGINHTVAKGVMPTHIRSFGFIFLRVGGAAILFWLISIFGPKEKIEKLLGYNII